MKVNRPLHTSLMALAVIAMATSAHAQQAADVGTAPAARAQVSTDAAPAAAGVVGSAASAPPAATSSPTTPAPLPTSPTPAPPPAAVQPVAAPTAPPVRVAARGDASLERVERARREPDFDDPARYGVIEGARESIEVRPRIVGRNNLIVAGAGLLVGIVGWAVLASTPSRGNNTGPFLVGLTLGVGGSVAALAGGIVGLVSLTSAPTVVVTDGDAAVAARWSRAIAAFRARTARRARPSQH